MHLEIYSDTLIEHFISPKNVGRMDNADGKGICGDPECGDFLNLFIKVENDVIVDIKFLVYGCAGAIATSSMTTVLAKGKTLEEAEKLTDDDIIRALGGMPENKQHCSLLGIKALRNAVQDYLQNKNKGNLNSSL